DWLPTELFYSPSENAFAVKGSHIYANPGFHRVVVFVQGPDGTSDSFQTTALDIAAMPSGPPGTPPSPAHSSPPLAAVIPPALCPRARAARWRARRRARLSSSRVPNVSRDLPRMWPGPRRIRPRGITRRA